MKPIFDAHLLSKPLPGEGRQVKTLKVASRLERKSSNFQNAFHVSLSLILCDVFIVPLWRAWRRLCVRAVWVSCGVSRWRRGEGGCVLLCEIEREQVVWRCSCLSEWQYTPLWYSGRWVTDSSAHQTNIARTQTPLFSFTVHLFIQFHA